MPHVQLNCTSTITVKINWFLGMLHLNFKLCIISRWNQFFLKDKNWLNMHGLWVKFKASIDSMFRLRKIIRISSSIFDKSHFRALGTRNYGLKPSKDIQIFVENQRKWFSEKNKWFLKKMTFVKVIL